MIRLQRILLPTDFSEFSAEATKYASALAEQFGAELHLLYVVDELPVLAPDYGGMNWQDFLDEMQTAARQQLASVLDPQWKAGQQVVEDVRRGTPFLEIVRYAKENDIDLIVLGTHGRSGLSHVLIGSVAERVVRSAPCPVLTVRPAGHQFVAP